MVSRSFIGEVYFCDVMFWTVNEIIFLRREFYQLT